MRMCDTIKASLSIRNWQNAADYRSDRDYQLDLNLNRIRNSGLPLGRVWRATPGDFRGIPGSPWQWDSERDRDPADYRRDFAGSAVLVRCSEQGHGDSFGDQASTKPVRIDK